MNCLQCRGACCEDLVFPVKGLAKPTFDLLRLRGQVVRLTEDMEGVAIPSVCHHLSDAGRCRIYHDRPGVCRMYRAGGQACIETLRRRRTPEDYILIRGPNDPLRVHEG